MKNFGAAVTTVTIGPILSRKSCIRISTQRNYEGSLVEFTCAVREGEKHESRARSALVGLGSRDGSGDGTKCSSTMRNLSSEDNTMQKPRWNPAARLAAIVSLSVLSTTSASAATDPVSTWNTIAIDAAETAGQLGAVLLATVQVRAQHSKWSRPINLGPVVNSPSSEIQVAITHSGLSLYIVSDRPGGYGANDIWVSHRVGQSAPWGEPKNLGPVINSRANDSGPNFSLDDHWMFFASPRLGTFGGSDIWVSYRDDVTDDFGWQEPINLGPNVNTSGPEADPFYFVDPTTGQATLYFTGFNRPGGLSDWDIFQSTQNEDGSFNPAVLNTELSTPYRDTRMTITNDGLEMILSSDRPGSIGGIDLWVSTRNSPTDPWSPPTNLGFPVDNAEDDRGPSGSNDGLLLFFASNRPGGAGSDDIYVSVRLSRPEHRSTKPEAP